MKEIFKIISLFVVIQFFQHCDEPEEIIEPLSQEFKDWGTFKSGTYWVYKEDNLNLYDTIKIYKSTSEYIQTDKSSLNHFWENINSYFFSTRQIDSGYFRVSSSSGVVAMIHENIDLGEHLRRCILVEPPPVQGDAINNGHVGQYVLFDTIFSTYKLGNLEFNNVVRANDNFNYFYLGTPTLFYSVKNIGIIRKEFPEYNQVWNLVDYQIVQ